MDPGCSLLTALPLRMAHSEVTAHAGWVLLGSFRAAEALNLLAEGFQGGVHLSIAVASVGVVGSVATAHGIGCLLLLRDKWEGLANTRWSGRSWRSGKTRSTLEEIEVEAQKGLIKQTVESGKGFIVLTEAPMSPLRPRGPGGPTGPGRPLTPSLPGEPLEPEGPYNNKQNRFIIVYIYDNLTLK